MQDLLPPRPDQRDLTCPRGRLRLLESIDDPEIVPARGGRIPAAARGRWRRGHRRCGPIDVRHHCSATTGCAENWRSMCTLVSGACATPDDPLRPGRRGRRCGRWPRSATTQSDPAQATRVATCRASIVASGTDGGDAALLRAAAGSTWRCVGASSWGGDGASRTRLLDGRTSSIGTSRSGSSLRANRPVAVIRRGTISVSSRTRFIAKIVVTVGRGQSRSCTSARRRKI